MKARNSLRRRRFLCAPVTLPVATSNAASRGAVPLIVVAVSRQRASVRQLQIALRALQRLDRWFLVDTYDDGIVGRRHVEADHIGSLAGELRIIALAPALATAEIDLVFAQGTPDVLHVDVTQGLRDQRSVRTGKAFGGR